MITELSKQTRLIRWSNLHSTILLAVCTAILLLSWPIELLLGSAASSFAWFVVRGQGNWPSIAQFGPANAVTLFRLLLIFSLATFTHRPDLIILLALLVLCLDGVDGWLARKFDCASEFGEYFDKETDAFFMLVLCWLIALDQRLGLWILLPGLMRYVFVCFLMIAKPPTYKEQQTTTGKVVFVVTILALISCFTDYPAIYRPLALAITLLLSYSFIASIRLIYRPARDDA
ncbi:CDP-alcohol phosphatidyltransferase family protein [Methylotuvimicrobium buryatense]|uniref:CDP-alcohol phosphatidyltransferase family protein n=1 Tax=Methylotuvimicrobium buryatense TaxID=95641 RepID=A0A4P9UM00_METBY|nr:CDP-alcohol phosphatidyltransferase family protein [Methylotuvimicrobium buryatense]QCW81433.1 hypothetical protein EQU24_03590 [Methylotuvimicrobium buryatense]